MARRLPPGPEQGRAGAFSVESRPWAGGTVLTLRGELDLGAAAELARWLAEALVVPGTTVVVDLGELGFCDSSGLSVLLRARTVAVAEGSHLELARPRPLVLRMLELTGAAYAFRIRAEPP
ncbi:hypothetical protein CFP65_7048 [Kitasatospora sp. MMS16-BH015]|uniref:STAS domain-containing protein n=1 Tax=Kitasatospora sp. MMS16-BH015 TaxID=2018025 RepID=UPI000CA392F4|nr:STAS domain-containing protein [Kitasatospora sp. MMS16-BH015]AUG81653.1 hypothetical protein CFP65_7048 [Kitasatospora sp. MMS16-BH015]